MSERGPTPGVFGDFLKGSGAFQEFCNQGDQLVARVLTDPTFESLSELNRVRLPESLKEEVSKGIERNLALLLRFKVIMEIMEEASIEGILPLVAETTSKLWETKLENVPISLVPVIIHEPEKGAKILMISVGLIKLVVDALESGVDLRKLYQ